MSHEFFKNKNNFNNVSTLTKLLLDISTTYDSFTNILVDSFHMSAIHGCVSLKNRAKCWHQQKIEMNNRASRSHPRNI